MNALAGSASPFLRHGARQPVAWQPWGEEAFERARREDRPILLDIGAVWCHWCHVMDRESYEDPDTAALINELFVPVKVDRDDRPDVDARYQRSVQALTGQGGWPLTAFLTSDGDVFHGGTYFPPEDAHGRPSFRRVLREVARVWSEERERAERAASSLQERLGEVLRAAVQPGELDPQLLDDGAEALAQAFDFRWGGFGAAPKFPNPGGVALLLDAWLDSGQDWTRRIVGETLGAMAAGGIHDQLGGGFHRYATDARWIIPHFEKMAYDNGPLLAVYARSAAALESDPLRRAAEGIVAYYRDVTPDLVEAGGFPASQDADAGPDDDGDYWTWTEAEVREALAAGPEGAAEAAVLRWGVRDPDSAMHLDPRRHVLREARPVEEVARRVGRSTDETWALLERSRPLLKAARDRRPRPYVDATLYAGWVGLVASGHVAAARHLGITGAGEAAARAMDRVWAEAWREGSGLAHRVGGDDPVVTLADQAHCAEALLDLWEWSQEERWLERARAVADVMVDRFADPSGALADVPSGLDAPVAALREGRLDITDSPEPAPNAVAAMVLARLGALLGDAEATATARRILRAFAGAAPRFAPSAGTYFRALRWVTRPVTTVVVVEAEPRGPLLRAALGPYRPETVVRGMAPGEVEGPGRDVLPEAVREMLTGASPRAYVCSGRTCAQPVADPAALTPLLRTFRG